MNGYKILVKLEETAKLVQELADKVKSLEQRLVTIETRKVGRPPRKAEECNTVMTNS